LEISCSRGWEKEKEGGKDGMREKGGTEVEEAMGSEESVSGEQKRPGMKRKEKKN